MLSCGLHKCPSLCHQLFDHSQLLCKAIQTQKCAKGHGQTWQCHQGAPPACPKCEREKRDLEKNAQKDFDEKVKREQRQQEHLKKLAKIDADIVKVTSQMNDTRLENEQHAVLAQKQKDLQSLRERANSAQASTLGDPLGIYDDNDSGPRKQVSSKLPKAPISPSSSRSGAPITTPPPTNLHSMPGSFPPSPEPQKLSLHQPTNDAQPRKTALSSNDNSPSRAEWERQKAQENAINPAIDKIMEMIGLEAVKEQVLRIKAKVETCIRQGTNIKEERLSLILLGNPGTGTIPRRVEPKMILC